MELLLVFAVACTALAIYAYGESRYHTGRRDAYLDCARMAREYMPDRRVR